MQFYLVYNRIVERRGGTDNKRALLQGKHLEKALFQNVMKATAHDTNVLDVIGEVHQLSSSLRDAVVQRQHYEEVVETRKGLLATHQDYWKTVVDDS